MQDGPLQRYRQMVLSRELAPDTAQELVADKLQLLANRLAQYSKPRLSALLPFGRRRRLAHEGLYLYGGVGRGKAMRLLDFFFDSVHYAPIDVLWRRAHRLRRTRASSMRCRLTAPAPRARSASQLMEMRSETYLAERHKRSGSASEPT